MSKKNYTNLDLLKNIKLNCMVPVDQIAFSDEDILLMASNELELGVLADILKAREEYYVYTKEFDINNTGRYPIPSRAAGGRLRIVYLSNGQGGIFPCSETSQKELPYLSNYYGLSYNNNALFYVENDEIVFIKKSDNDTQASKVVIKYYLDPNTLVLPENCLKIKSINTTTGYIEVDENQIPASILATSEIDFIQAIPTNKIKAHDIELLTTSPNTPVSSQKYITVAPADLPSDLKVGDWIAVAGETPVPQLISNIRPVLAQFTACKILESQGDVDLYKVADHKRQQMVKSMTPLIQDRTEGNPKKIISRNGILRNSLIGRYGRRGN